MKPWSPSSPYSRASVKGSAFIPAVRDLRIRCLIWAEYWMVSTLIIVFTSFSFSIIMAFVFLQFFLVIWIKEGVYNGCHPPQSPQLYVPDCSPASTSWQWFLFKGTLQISAFLSAICAPHPVGSVNFSHVIHQPCLFHFLNLNPSIGKKPR